MDDFYDNVMSKWGMEFGSKWGRRRMLLAIAESHHNGEGVLSISSASAEKSYNRSKYCIVCLYEASNTLAPVMELIPVCNVIVRVDKMSML